MTAMDNICDVCRRKSDWVGVHSSSLGPMSFASCRECLEHYAEQETTFHYIYDYVSNKGQGLHESMNYFNTWKDYKYMSWPEWVAWRQDPIRVTELDAQAEADIAELNKYDDAN